MHFPKEVHMHKQNSISYEGLDDVEADFRRIRSLQSKRPQYGEALKQRVLSLAESGVPISVLAKRCGIAAAQIYSWRSEATKASSVLPTAHAIHTVPVVPDKKTSPRFLLVWRSLRIELG